MTNPTDPLVSYEGSGFGGGSQAAAVNVQAVVGGGYTPAHFISAATTNATLVKASPATLGHINAGNLGTTPAYIKIYNSATIPTAGAGTPVQVFLIPSNGTTGAASNIPLPAQGIALSAGFGFTITGGIADTDTTAVALNQVVLNYDYI